MTITILSAFAIVWLCGYVACLAAVHDSPRDVSIPAAVAILVTWPVCVIIGSALALWNRVRSA